VFSAKFQPLETNFFTERLQCITCVLLELGQLCRWQRSQVRGI